MFNKYCYYEMYVEKQKYFNHDLSAVDIPFVEIIYTKNSLRRFTDFYFIKLQILLTLQELSQLMNYMHKCNFGT